MISQEQKDQILDNEIAAQRDKYLKPEQPCVSVFVSTETTVNAMPFDHLNLRDLESLVSRLSWAKQQNQNQTSVFNCLKR